VPRQLAIKIDGFRAFVVAEVRAAEIHQFGGQVFAAIFPADRLNHRFHFLAHFSIRYADNRYVVDIWMLDGIVTLT
jgi:hypothetical protein